MVRVNRGDLRSGSGESRHRRWAATDFIEMELLGTSRMEGQMEDE